MFTSLSIYCFIELYNFLSDFISLKKDDKNQLNNFFKMSGSFPKAFSQAATSQGYFPK